MASWEELARNFLLEEEEEDEELFFVLLPAVMPFLDEEKTPEHTFSLSGAKRLKRSSKDTRIGASKNLEWRLKYLEL